jgi:hypothetical protein
VAPDELEKAKRRYSGDLEAGFDDLDGLCGWFGGTELFFRPYSHVERARARAARDPRRRAERGRAGVPSRSPGGGGGGSGEGVLAAACADGCASSASAETRP